MKLKFKRRQKSIFISKNGDRVSEYTALIWDQIQALLSVGLMPFLVKSHQFSYFPYMWKIYYGLKRNTASGEWMNDGIHNMSVES